MRVVSELIEYLYRQGLLSEDQLRELSEMGAVPQDFYCCVCGTLLCDDPTHDYDEPPWFYESQSIEDWREDDPEPAVRVSSKRAGRPSSHSIRADEIAKRIESSELLKSERLEPFKVLHEAYGGDGDWWKSLHRLTGRELKEALLKALMEYRLSPSQLWEALVFDDYRRVLELEDSVGQAVTAWRQVIRGCGHDEIGKCGWILGTRPEVNKVWQLVRTQNAVLRTLAALMRAKASELSSWADRDYHPIGSLLLCLLYDALSHKSRTWNCPPTPEWSNWHGQRYRNTRWSESTAQSRIWEMMFRMDGALAYEALLRSREWEHSLSLESSLPRPRYWDKRFEV